jgi:hypothetical protein
MRRRDLESSKVIPAGLYLIDGDPGDPNGIVVGGPFPDTFAGRLAAEAAADRLKLGELNLTRVVTLLES